MKRIAINGFGRIGRSFLRTILEDRDAREGLDIVAINIGPAEPKMIAQLFKYDSIMGVYPGKIVLKGNTLHIDTYRIAIIAECDPSKLPWKKHKVDWVVEATGCFTDKKSASCHLKAGAKKVLITAPASGEDITIIPGVNDKEYKANTHNIVALGSCTTNCFAPIIKVLSENFGLTYGLMNAVHAYTNTQVLLDIEARDPRRARAAALNIIPTTTGASKLITKIFPKFKGKLDAVAIRVPVPIVSLIDFTFTTKEKLSEDMINKAFKKASQGSLRHIMAYATEPLVSSDYKGHPASCIIDSLLTQTAGNLGKVFAWYDNEWGFSTRLKDFLLHIA